MRSIGRAKPIRAIHAIPPRFSPVYKIELITDTETINLTPFLYDGYYLDGVTSTIGDFEFSLIDPSNDITNRIEDFDTVKVYLDYGKTATTLRFSGKIEKMSNQDQIFLNIYGRSIAMITTGTNITYSSGGSMARSVILKEIIDANFSGLISTANIEDDLTEIEVNYEETPFWGIVEEICSSGGRDAYINNSSVFNYFVKGSRLNITEVVAENSNLVKTDDYGADTEEIFTKVRVYGKKIQGIPILSSSESDTSNTKGIVKDLKIDNASVDNSTQATDLATAEASDRKFPPTIGNVTSLLLPTLLPGEKVMIDNPTNNIPPTHYEINSFRHVFSISDSPKTELIIKKRKLDVARIIKSNIRFKSESPDNLNKNDMDFSIIYDFSEEEGNFVDTERAFISSGDGGYYVIKTTSGNSSGTWTSPVNTFDSSIAKLEFRIVGDALAGTPPEGTKIRYSLNGGNSFTTWGSETVIVPTGVNLVIQVVFSSAETQVSAVSALFTLT